MKKLTIKRLYDVLDQEDTLFDMGQGGYKSLFKHLTYSDVGITIIIEFSKQRSLYIRVQEPSIGVVNVASVQSIEEKMDCEIPWQFTGVWVEIVEKFVEEKEAYFADVSNEFEQKLRIIGLFS